MTDPTSLPNFAQAGPPQTPAAPPQAGGSLREKALAALAADNIPAQVDDDGDIVYALQEQQLLVRCIDSEPGLALLRIFGQWQITEDLPTEPAKRLNAANDVNLAINFVKLGIAGDNLIVAGDHLVGPYDDVAELIKGTSGMLLQAVQAWHQAVTGAGPHVAEATPEQLQASADALADQARAAQEGGEFA